MGLSRQERGDQTMTGFDRKQMAARVAEDIPEGWFVNLGIGIPTMIANYVPLEREVILHSENGILGMGPAPAPDKVDPWLVNAGKQAVTLRPGGSYFHHADSFAMIRGGHIDLCVLGAFEVAANGDIANWATSENDSAPAVGGAMSPASSASRRVSAGSPSEIQSSRRARARPTRERCQGSPSWRVAGRSRWRASASRAMP
jgi:3-oxoadipate CoA-transferase beta subunit